MHFRARLRRELTAMRWQVREAAGGAEAMAQLEAQSAEAMVLDSALPDLEASEFAGEMRMRHPVMDLLRMHAVADEGGSPQPAQKTSYCTRCDRRRRTRAAPRSRRERGVGAGASGCAADLRRGSSGAGGHTRDRRSALAGPLRSPNAAN